MPNPPQAVVQITASHLFDTHFMGHVVNLGNHHRGALGICGSILMLKSTILFLLIAILSSIPNGTKNSSGAVTDPLHENTGTITTQFLHCNTVHLLHHVPVKGRIENHGLAGKNHGPGIHTLKYSTSYAFFRVFFGAGSSLAYLIFENVIDENGPLQGGFY